MNRSLMLVPMLMTLSVAATATAGGNTPPAHSDAFGASLVTWQQRWMQWAFGSSTNPLMNSICGEKVGSVFFLNASEGPGTEVDCHIPPGTPLVGTAGGFIGWVPTDAATPAGLPAARDQGLSAVSNVHAILDGRPLNLEGALTSTDVFTISLEDGNFIQAVDPNVVGDTTQAASGGWFVRITPLTPGRHELVFSDEIEELGVFDITFHILV